LFQGNLILRICSFIVDTGAHRIIIDACVGNEKTRHNQKWNGMKTDLYDRITAAGYHPDSITEVICTHLHDDHCGGCTRKNEHGEWVPVYRNATHIYARTEFEHWRVTPYKDDDLVFQDSVKPVMDAGLAQLVNSEYQVAAGISLFPTPGHTPGHVSVLISSRDKQAIITGDMIHNPLQIAEPTITSIFDSDSAKAVQTRLAFLKKWTDGKTVIIGTQ
jgi:glyoxylase-like metal-dependent hydrolase (beta-lactamase superfamily II)